LFSAKHNRVFIVAEISGNHGMDLDKAFELVKIAKWAGADAVKLQTYTADTITLNSDAQVRGKDMKLFIIYMQTPLLPGNGMRRYLIFVGPTTLFLLAVRSI
jgi:sialic acid synthase SpsE